MQATRSIDGILRWVRHRGGTAQVGVVSMALEGHIPPVLADQEVEEIDFRPGLCALIREHADRQRDMYPHEQLACIRFLQDLPDHYIKKVT